MELLSPNHSYYSHKVNLHKVNRKEQEKGLSTQNSFTETATASDPNVNLHIPPELGFGGLDQALLPSISVSCFMLIIAGMQTTTLPHGKLRATTHAPDKTVKCCYADNCGRKGEQELKLGGGRKDEEEKGKGMVREHGEQEMPGTCRILGPAATQGELPFLFFPSASTAGNRKSSHSPYEERPVKGIVNLFLILDGPLF